MMLRLSQIKVQLTLVQGSVFNLLIFNIVRNITLQIMYLPEFPYQVGIGVAVVVFGLVFAFGDFLPSGRWNYIHYSNESLPLYTAHIHSLCIVLWIFLLFMVHYAFSSHHLVMIVNNLLHIQPLYSVTGSQLHLFLVTRV
jgi:hypothetical protein